MFVAIFALCSVAVALAILFASPPPDRPRDWRLRSSWALWTLQPAVLIGSLLVALNVWARYGYDNSNAPADVEAWTGFAIFGSVGLVLLAGTVLGGLAWRRARSERPPTSRRWWALAATLANAMWFAVGAWLMGSAPVSLTLDVVILVLAPLLLLWPPRQEADRAAPEPVGEVSAADAPDEHLVG